jgi:hypothetical protein
MLVSWSSTVVKIREGYLFLQVGQSQPRSVRSDKQLIAGDNACRVSRARRGRRRNSKEWRVESVQEAVCSWLQAKRYLMNVVRGEGEKVIAELSSL